MKWLDKEHGSNWAIWEFRAEGTGYPDSEVYGRIRHYPWPDHHPPPFALIPNIMASMRNWLRRREEGDTGFKEFKADGGEEKRVVVVHCKAGKGRSGTVACSYLISQEGWKRIDALKQFTGKRMRAGFGEGVSIPSQLRWVGYVERWTENGKTYVERPVEILEVRTWGLRDGVKVAIEGYVDGGRTIKTFHVFNKRERLVFEGKEGNKSDPPISPSPNADLTSPAIDSRVQSPLIDEASTVASPSSLEPRQISAPAASSTAPNSLPRQGSASTVKSYAVGAEPGGRVVIFKPNNRIILPSSDICLDLERRNRAAYGWTMVTSVAHVWFNVFFEGLQAAPSDMEKPRIESSGIFEIQWDAMDGIKGSSRKGTRALDRVAVVWRVLDEQEQEIKEPQPGEEVPEMQAAEWQGDNEVKQGDSEKKRDLGLRVETPTAQSTDISRASSIRSAGETQKRGGSNGFEGDSDYEDSMKGVEVGVRGGGGGGDKRASLETSHDKPNLDGDDAGDHREKAGLGRVAGIVSEMRKLKMDELPDHKERPPGKLVRADHAV